MKKLSLLLLIMFFASCAQERTTSREVQRKIEAAGMMVSNVQGLYYADISTVDDELYCNDFDYFAQQTNINLGALYLQFPGFDCLGSMDEVIVAVEMNQNNTGGNLFLIIFPNDINSIDPNNYIWEGTSAEYNKWGFGVSFTVYNQAGTTGNFNSFGSFNAILDDGYNSTMTMNTADGMNYLLSVMFGNQPLIMSLPLLHSSN